MPFVKGKSGNPKGRPKTGLSLAESIRAVAPPKWIAEKIKAVAETTEDPSVQIRALAMLADYGFGKPAQAITGPDGDPLQLVFQQAIINAQTEFDPSTDDLPICISGGDGQSA